MVWAKCDQGLVSTAGCTSENDCIQNVPPSDMYVPTHPNFEAKSVALGRWRRGDSRGV